LQQFGAIFATPNSIGIDRVRSNRFFGVSNLPVIISKIAK